jgi:hypothetical protein
MRGSLIVGLVCIAAVCAAAFLFHSFSAFEAEHRSFSQEEWQREKTTLELSADPGCTLGPMTQDLLQSGRLQGAKREQVVQLLGQPRSQTGDLLIYPIGQCHGWGWHHSELVLVLSPSKAVRRVEVRRVQ